MQPQELVGEDFRSYLSTPWPYDSGWSFHTSDPVSPCRGLQDDTLARRAILATWPITAVLYRKENLATSISTFLSSSGFFALLEFVSEEFKSVWVQCVRLTRRWECLQMAFIIHGSSNKYFCLLRPQSLACGRETVRIWPDLDDGIQHGPQRKEHKAPPYTCQLRDPHYLYFIQPLIPEVSCFPNHGNAQEQPILLFIPLPYIIIKGIIFVSSVKTQTQFQMYFH